MQIQLRRSPEGQFKERFFLKLDLRDNGLSLSQHQIIVETLEQISPPFDYDTLRESWSQLSDGDVDSISNSHFEFNRQIGSIEAGTRQILDILNASSKPRNDFYAPIFDPPSARDSTGFPAPQNVVGDTRETIRQIMPRIEDLCIWPRYGDDFQPHLDLLEEIAARFGDRCDPHRECITRLRVRQQIAWQQFQAEQAKGRIPVLTTLRLNPDHTLSDRSSSQDRTI